MEAEIFGYKLTPGQLKIVGAVLDPDILRLSVCAMTRYGKTRAASIGLLLHILNSPTLDAPERILLVAPTIPQTNIIRNYMSELISNTPELVEIVDTPARDALHLRQEMSKKRLTFKNGWEMLTLTAHGKGEQLMGFGGKVVVLDEAALIADEVYTSRISRMLGDNPESKLIELVNPWHRHNFAYEHWKNPDFKHIHIDYRQALREGRATETFIEEQRKELSTYEFTVLYDSEFAEDSEDTLIRWSWIEAANKRKITFVDDTYSVWGLDVAEAGADLTVLKRCITDGLRYQETDTFVIKENETMPTAKAVSAIVPKKERLNVDSIGVGAGVYSRLKELGHTAVSIRGSNSPTVGAERFLNLKAQRYWQLRSIFETGLIGTTADKHTSTQLSNMRYEFTSSGKIKIVDPENKSPDFSDALCLCLLSSVRPPRAATSKR